MMESMRRLEARVDNMCERFEARISILEAQRSAADAFSGSTAENTNPITGRPHTPQKKAVTAVDDKTTPIRDFPRSSNTFVVEVFMKDLLLMSPVGTDIIS